MPTYTASELLRLRTVDPCVDKPTWANQVAEIIDSPCDLCGPGLYALFLNGALFYIGLHVGKRAEFDYSVLHRWKLHVVGQTLRAREISFSRRPISTLLKNLPPTDVSEGLAACLPDGRYTNLAALENHPLLQGSHCTVQKASFAARHWDVLGPGNENEMLDRIACVFQPVPDGWQDMLLDANGHERGSWVRERWLRAPETELVKHFRPICNAATPVGSHRDDVKLADVVVKMESAFPKILPQFNRDDYSSYVMRRKAASPSVVEAYAAGPGPTPDEDETLMAEEEGMSAGEFRFRRKLTELGTNLIDALRDQCPPSMELYFTDTPDVRIRVTGQRSPMVRLTTARGQLRCFTRASVLTCQSFGFNARTVNDPMSTSFYFDPATVAPTAIIQLVGKAKITD